MQAGFAEAGLPTLYGGAHGNGLTHMALAGFEDGSYLELIAPLATASLAKASGMMAGWMPLMVGNAGPGAWAIRVSDIHAKAQELRARGMAVQGPEVGGRKRPDGIQLEWETALVGLLPAGSVLPFMIEDRSERSLRVQLLENTSGLRGIARVVIAVRELAVSEALFRRAYIWPEARKFTDAEFGARLAHFADTPVILAEPSGPHTRTAERLRGFGEGPMAFLFAGALNPSEHIPARLSSWFGDRIRWLPETIVGAQIGVIAR